MIKPRLLLLLILLLLFLVACGQDSGVENPAGPSETALIPQATTAVEAPATSETAPPTDEPAGAARTTPAGNDIPAAPTTVFNPDGYNSRAGSQFIVLDEPVMVTAVEADWLQPDEIVMGVEVNGETQAFPIRQMAYHHLANTTVGGEPYLVTY